MLHIALWLKIVLGVVGAVVVVVVAIVALAFYGILKQMEKM